MAILVIEDDPKTGDYLRKGLRESGYVVDLARGVTACTWHWNRITTWWCWT
jgi:DNA-binding response OmpR family regulator